MVEERPDAVQLGSDGNQAHFSCNRRWVALLWRGHWLDGASSTHQSPGQAACLDVGTRNAKGAPDPCLCCNEVPVGSQLGKGNMSPRSIRCLVTITGILSAPPGIVCWGQFFEPPGMIKKGRSRSKRAPVLMFSTSPASLAWDWS